MAVVFHLAFANHMHDLVAREDDARTPKILEAHHWPDDTFDEAVVLLDDVNQKFFLADLDRPLGSGVEGLERSQIPSLLSIVTFSGAPL
ncbi:hypothetical protein F4827_004125 [Paraburkholderia bannensis]|uniref:Uncharacterized protein n=1 Tax=Paraburkholderia bannensis TaxID=765414 RepID=A0A7W9TZI6_9BURK|nr:hypothetical protein [Paraburkholderia sp. WP4_3_2]MBB6104266.1 hypothetical protein [Paraburkholderia bannensis]